MKKKNVGKILIGTAIIVTVEYVSYKAGQAIGKWLGDKLVEIIEDEQNEKAKKIAAK